MNLQRRFALQFSTQIVSFIILFIVIALSMLLLLGYALTKEEQSSNSDLMAITGLGQSIDSMENLNPTLLQRLKKQQVWLLIYDEDKKLSLKNNVPKNIPTTYTKLFKNENIDYNLFPLELDNQHYTVVLGKINQGKVDLTRLNQQIDWSGVKLPAIKTKNPVYYIDKDGTVLDSLNDKHPEEAIEELYDEYRYELLRFTDETSGKQLIVANRLADDDFLVVWQHLVPLLIILLIVVLIIFGLFVYFYTRKFANPMLHFMKWIRKIEQKNYQAPINKRGKPIFRNKKGRIRRRFRLYKDMVETMEHMTTELSQYEQQRSQMEKMREEWISGLSHDLKTPLSTVIGYTKMLRSTHDWSKEEQQQFLEVMDDKAHYMKELIDDLTLTYRLKNNCLPLNIEEIELTEWLRRSLIQLMNTSEAEKYHFDFISEQEKAYVKIDPILFQRVIDNLLINALKHNSPGTRIQLKTYLAEDQQMIVIQDNGSGMDQETVKQLFNRYYRGTATTESIEGTGLGMAITDQLIKLHHGTINVESILEKGTIITISLPKSN